MIATLYGLFGVYIITSEIIHYLKNKKINYFTIFSIYFFAYYIMPAFVHNFSTNYVSRYRYTFSYGDGTYLAFFLIFLAFFSVKFGYAFFLTKRKRDNENISQIVRKIKNEKKFFDKAIIILWIIGFLALLVHCYLYGGVVNAITNSALVRDGKIESEAAGTIGFISRFIICLMYSSYFVFIKFLKKETPLHKFIFSVFWAILYLVIHAGRAAILTYIITNFFIYIVVNEKKIKLKNWIILFFIVLLGISYARPLLVSMTSLKEGFDAFWNAFLNRINNASNTSSITNNLFYKLCYNLEHKYVSLEISIRAIKNGQYSFNLFKDVWIALISVFPSAILPFSKPNPIGYYNTVLINGYNSTTGTIPPGGVAFGYYALGVVGVIIFSLFVGAIGRKIVNYLDSFNSKYFMGMKVINMFVWVDFFINGELKESVIRYFVFLVILIITFFCSKKVVINNENNNQENN